MDDRLIFKCFYYTKHTNTFFGLNSIQLLSVANSIWLVSISSTGTLNDNDSHCLGQEKKNGYSIYEWHICGANRHQWPIDDNNVNIACEQTNTYPI